MKTTLQVFEFCILLVVDTLLLNLVQGYCGNIESIYIKNIIVSSIRVMEIFFQYFKCQQH